MPRHAFIAVAQDVEISTLDVQGAVLLADLRTTLQHNRVPGQIPDPGKKSWTAGDVDPWIIRRPGPPSGGRDPRASQWSWPAAIQLSARWLPGASAYCPGVTLSDAEVMENARGADLRADPGSWLAVDAAPERDDLRAATA